MWKLKRNRKYSCFIHVAASRLHRTDQTFRKMSSMEKSYNLLDRTLRFVDREDEMDFLYEEFASPRAEMSCGHAVTPMSLTNWCRRLLEEGKSKFVCGQPNCNREWPYVEVRKMALLTPEEREYFESTMALNTAREYFNSKTCPGCNYSVTRKTESNLSVRCQICTVRKGRAYEFCWQCLKEWKGPQPRTDRCDNDGCFNEALKTLRTCPEIIFESVKNVRGCPSIRACPTCGSLLEHTSKKCKNLLCPRCRVEFCFVCLKVTYECLKTSTHFEPCSDGVAPRQTSIPVWHQ